LEIVNFAVEGKPDGPVFIAHRLAARIAHVNDCESVVGKGNGLRNDRRAEALREGSVWPAMAEGTRHSLDYRLKLSRSEALARDAGNAAHGSRRAGRQLTDQQVHHADRLSAFLWSDRHGGTVMNAFDELADQPLMRVLERAHRVV